jgi:hypothetical protein
MTTCGNGHIVNKNDMDAAFNNASHAFAEVKAEGHVPSNMPLSLTIGFPGVASPAHNKMNFDLQYAACLKTNQIKAIMLHEAGHIHEGLSPSLVIPLLVDLTMAAVLITVPLFRLSRSVVRAFRKQENYKKNWRIVSIAATGLCASQIASTIAIRNLELNADLYAAKAIGKPDDVQSFLLESGKIVTDGTSYDKIPKIKGNEFAEYIGAALVAFGPEGFFFTHPSIRYRISVLENKRPEIVKYHPAPQSRRASLAP